LHEIGHCLAAFRVGGSADQIVLGPLGGLATPHVPHEPQNELACALAGPAVNFLVCLMLAPPLAMAGADVLGLLRPLQPKDVTEGALLLAGLKLTFWINWLLVLVNMLPA